MRNAITSGWSGGKYGPRRPLGPNEIDRLLVPSGKASSLSTDRTSDYWLTAQARPCTVNVAFIKLFIRISLVGLVGCLYSKTFLDVLAS